MTITDGTSVTITDGTSVTIDTHPLSLVLPLRDGIRSRRIERCPDCWLPLSSCVCAELPHLETHTRVVILMHSMEAKRTSNTGRLAARVLSATVRMRGQKAPPPRTELPAGRRLLLFPAPGARVLSPADAGPDRPLLLVPTATGARPAR